MIVPYIPCKDADQLVRLVLRTLDRARGGGRAFDSAAEAMADLVAAPETVLLHLPMQPRLPIARAAGAFGMNEQRQMAICRRLDRPAVRQVLEQAMNSREAAGGAMVLDGRQLGEEPAEPTACAWRRGDEDHWLLAVMVRRAGQTGFAEQDAALAEMFLSHTMAALTGGPWAGQKPAAPKLPGAGAELTDRLRQVLAHLHAGRSPEQIGQLLHISRHTVYDHIKKLHRCYGVSNRTQLLAVSRGGGTG